MNKRYFVLPTAHNSFRIYIPFFCHTNLDNFVKSVTVWQDHNITDAHKGLWLGYETLPNFDICCIETILKSELFSLQKCELNEFNFVVPV